MPLLHINDSCVYFCLAKYATYIILHIKPKEKVVATLDFTLDQLIEMEERRGTRW